MTLTESFQVAKDDYPCDILIIGLQQKENIHPPTASQSEGGLKPNARKPRSAIRITGE